MCCLFLKNWKIWLCIIIGIVIGIVIAEFFIYKIPKTFNILSADNKYFYLNGTKLENVYIISNSDAKIIPETKNVIIMGNITFDSRMIDDNTIEKLDNIYFLSTKPTIDCDLYEKIKNKIKYISSKNECLMIKFIDNDSSDTK